jgi:hypothetical protein
MPQIVKQPRTQIRVVPRDGEIEITLNINITVDGEVTASSVNAQSVSVIKEEEEEAKPMIPDFFSGAKLKFGKTKEET